MNVLSLKNTPLLGTYFPAWRGRGEGGGTPLQPLCLPLCKSSACDCILVDDVINRVTSSFVLYNHALGTTKDWLGDVMAQGIVHAILTNGSTVTWCCIVAY